MAGRGERGMLGIVVHGSGGPLDALGVPADAALTPFAGSYRFLDLALATLANSRVRTLGGARDVRGPQAVPPPHGRGGRAARVLEALRRLTSSRLGGITAVAVLSADHVLQLDLRELHILHRDLGADVTLAGLPVPFGEQEPRRCCSLDAIARWSRSDARPRPRSRTCRGQVISSCPRAPSPPFSRRSPPRRPETT